MHTNSRPPIFQLSLAPPNSPLPSLHSPKKRARAKEFSLWVMGSHFRKDGRKGATSRGNTKILSLWVVVGCVVLLFFCFFNCCFYFCLFCCCSLFIVCFFMLPFFLLLFFLLLQFFCVCSFSFLFFSHFFMFFVIFIVMRVVFVTVVFMLLLLLPTPNRPQLRHCWTTAIVPI